MKISYSSVSAFLACPRQWYLSYQLGYGRPQPEIPLIRGSAVHAALEAYYRLGRQESALLPAFDKYVAKAERAFSALPDWENYRDRFQLEVSGARRAVEIYPTHEFADRVLKGTVYAVEERFSIPLTDTIQMNGVLDLVLETPGGLWIVDHKTHSSAQNYGGLDVDQQMTAYCWALWKTKGILARGVIYNGLITSIPQSSEPALIRNGKALSKAKDQTVLPQDYRAAIERHGFNIADYEDILTHLSTVGLSNFFARSRATRNQIELQAFEERLRIMADRMQLADSDPNKYAFAQPSTLTCGDCPFLQVCKSWDDGGDPQIILSSQFLTYDQRKSKGLII